MRKEPNLYLHLAALLPLIYCVVFLKLGSYHIRWWDESMFAVNTYEMIGNGKWFSLYFNGVPDLYNTKPPLTCWFQVLFVKLIGYNELAVRLPSAIAAGITVIAVFWFTAKRLNIVWAWISGMILLTSSGFLHFHTGRTAEADSLLTCFLTLANLSFISYLFDSRKSQILLFFIFITLAFATKLYAALLFAPAYLIILLWQRRLKAFVLNWQFPLALVFFLSVATFLICMRQLDMPQYLNLILQNDAGRLFNVGDNHSGSVVFYVTNLFQWRFSIWAVLFVAGTALAILREDNRNLLFSILTLVGIYLAIISFSVTKLEWYDMPIYPLLSIVSAYPLFVLFQNINVLKRPNSKAITVLFVATIFAYPYYLMFDKQQGNTIPNGEKGLEANERYIFKAIKEGQNLNGLKVYHSMYSGSLLFYKFKLADAGQALTISPKANFVANDLVLVSNDSLKRILTENYKFSILDRWEGSELVRMD